MVFFALKTDKKTFFSDYIVSFLNKLVNNMK